MQYNMQQPGYQQQQMMGQPGYQQPMMQQQYQGFGQPVQGNPYSQQPGAYNQNNMA